MGDLIIWGTGMITISSTFCPHPERVIRDLFRLLHAVLHGMEALVYSNHPRGAAASSYLAIIFGRIDNGIPWFLRSTAVPMQLSHQCRRWCSLKYPAIECLTLGLSHGMNEVTFRIVTVGTIRPEDSRAV